MTWTLPKLPDLSAHKRLSLDTETTGLCIWHGARPIGLSVCGEDRKPIYLPWGHPTGAQYDKAVVMDWARKELRDKVITMHHGKFDLMQLWSEGVDLRKFNNTFRDTLLAGPLLDEFGKFSLNEMSRRYLNQEKIDLPVAGEHICSLPSEEVGAYAEQDALLTWDLDNATYRLLQAEDLLKVYELECRVLPAVVEMETNGLRLDVEKCRKWIKDIRIKLTEMQKRIHFINPFQAIAIKKHFDANRWEYPFNYSCDDPDCRDTWWGFKGSVTECQGCGGTKFRAASPHFGKEFLKSSDIPFARDLLFTRKLDRLLNYFLMPWITSCGDEGIWRYELHQLKRHDNEEVGGRGSISGRFSATTVHDGEGAQPQQIWHPEKQIEEIGDDFVLRELFIADEGQQFSSSDASQIEFRMFGHYSKAPLILNAYRENPWADFHQMVTDVIFKGKVTRKKGKNINFGKLYTMGRRKLAKAMGLSLKEATDMSNEYDAMFPEAKSFSETASRLARERGFVRTIFGRKARFVGTEKLHAAANRIIQGSAADVMKDRLVAVYENKDALQMKMRVTVHDELNGDVPDDAAAKRVNECLTDFSMSTRVPLLWKTEVGKNWAMR